MTLIKKRNIIFGKKEVMSFINSIGNLFFEEKNLGSKLNEKALIGYSLVIAATVIAIFKTCYSHKSAPRTPYIELDASTVQDRCRVRTVKIIFPIGIIYFNIIRPFKFRPTKLIERLNNKEPLDDIIFSTGIYWKILYPYILPKVQNLLINKREHLKFLVENEHLLTNLEHLTLDTCHTIAQFPQAPKLKKLSFIDCSNITIPTMAIDDLTIINTTQALRTYSNWVENTWLGARAGIYHIQDRTFSEPPYFIISPNLSITSLTVNGCPYIRNLSGLPNLTNLHIIRCSNLKKEDISAEIAAKVPPKKWAKYKPGTEDSIHFNPKTMQQPGPEIMVKPAVSYD